MTLAEYLERQQVWSEQTFGPGQRTGGITKHIEKEINEVRENPRDLTEWIDVMILAMDGYWRHGGTPDTIMRDLIAKQAENFSRRYLPPTSEDEPSEHIRS